MDPLYLDTLQNELEQNGDPQLAEMQKAYLRNQFEFYGLKAPQRKILFKPFLIATYLPDKSDLAPLMKVLWSKPQREYHYFGMVLMEKYVKKLEKSDLPLLEYMVTHQSWWDTVDFIASHLLGAYFKLYPEESYQVTQRWLDSNHMWLQRCALIFQLKYKKSLDHVLLAQVIEALLGSKAFFINKAIGWVLREYSKTNPDWVVNFVENHDLNALSKREALRLIN